MSHIKGPPSALPQDRAAREAYETRRLDKMCTFMIEADNARLEEKRRADYASVLLERFLNLWSEEELIQDTELRQLTAEIKEYLGKHED